MDKQVRIGLLFVVFGVVLLVATADDSLILKGIGLLFIAGGSSYAGSRDV